MYLEFFKLKELPFRLTPDYEFLYMSGAHSRAKAYMDYSVWNREGFVVITGEVGCGKTTLIQKLLSELDENVVVAKIFQTQLDEVEFLQSVLVDFGLNPFNAKKVELIDMLNTFLLDNFLELKQLVLIVDDAHNLSMKVLEEIRMFSGLETRKEKVLHVILLGQPSLNDMLDAPEMEQLLQRVRLRYHIKSLSESDTRDYIHHRLRVAGALDPTNIFTPDTFPIIYKYTGGLPRLINTLCDTAMTCAFADNIHNVSMSILNTATQELQWLPYAKRVNKRRAGIGDFGGTETQGLLRDNIKTLANNTNQLARFESMVPALSSISGKMANIEALLKRIADSLEADKLGMESIRAKHGKEK
jgi:type II secretory pathway predicted ATPase ExeA